MRTARGKVSVTAGLLSADDESVDSRGQPLSAYEGIDDFARHIDSLRNEEPVWVSFYPEWKPPRFLVGVTREPPGEQENDEE